MNLLYIGVVAFLFLLAIFDLVVGVSNDAVNFLNSAIGSKVAKFKTIILVSTIGIFCGATFSDGMMSIARSGIMNPQYYYFSEVMVIFLAVMISDVVLLDVFNSLGYPTSTTVSMVFELLGGTFAMAMIKSYNDSSLVFGSLLNTNKALQVIFSIFLSVAVAFFFGALVQYLTRMLFTFNYKYKIKYKIGLFGGVALTALVYFILIKGLKHANFMTPELHQVIDNYTGMVVLGCFVFFTVLMQILHSLKVNVFKIIVLVGTFALAMAFAGNDLVNFIGVPLAGFSSFVDFTQNAAGVAPNAYLMTSLLDDAHTPIYFLLIAGAVMVISLITSPKAHNVVKTSLDLSRQEAGDEMFGSSSLARNLVRVNQQFAQKMVNALPQKSRTWLDNRFNTDETILENGAAFDLVRASVNLVLAGLLIAVGTSLKLPLSTTYVAFMVAMGSSLADKAWGRETAVFRITGVLSVIGGWFLTAGIAFILCFLVVSLIHIGGNVVAVLLIIGAIILIVRSNISFSRKKNVDTDQNLFTTIMSQKKSERTATFQKYFIDCLVDNLVFVSTTYHKSIEAFTDEDLRGLRKSQRNQTNRREALKKLRTGMILSLRQIDTAWVLEHTTWFHLSINSSTQLLYSLKRMTDPLVEHVDNNFTPIPSEWAEEYEGIMNDIINLIQRIEFVLRSNNFKEYSNVTQSCEDIYGKLSMVRKRQLERIQKDDSKTSMRTQTIYLNMIQEGQELVNNLKYVMRYSNKFVQ